MKARLWIILCMLLSAVCGAACGGGSDHVITPPPDTELDWDDGNWDEQNWQ